MLDGVLNKRLKEKWWNADLLNGKVIKRIIAPKVDLELKPIDAVQLDGMRLQGYSRIVTSVGPNNKGFTGMEQ